MRSVVAVALLAFPALGLAGGTVNLNKSGVLDRLKEERPAHYEKVAQVLDAASHPACHDRNIGRLKVSHELGRFDCTGLLLTSFPAQRDVRFEIDGIAYQARVSMAYVPGRIVKALEK